DVEAVDNLRLAGGAAGVGVKIYHGVGAQLGLALPGQPVEQVRDPVLADRDDHGTAVHVGGDVEWLALGDHGGRAAGGRHVRALQDPVAEVQVAQADGVRAGDAAGIHRQGR